MNTNTALLQKLDQLNTRQLAYFASDIHKDVFYTRPHHWTAEQWADREWLIKQICNLLTK